MSSQGNRVGEGRVEEIRVDGVPDMMERARAHYSVRKTDKR